MKKLIKLTRGNPSFNAVAFWSSESRGSCNQMQKKPNKDEFVIWSITSIAILTKMIYKQIWGETTSSIHSPKIEEDDPRTWKRGRLWIMRNGFHAAMLLLSLSFWEKCIVYCTCGLCLSHTDDMRRLNRKRLDALSNSNHVIEKKCSHGARHGKSEEPIYYHKSFNAFKRCRKKSDESGQHFSVILDRSLKDSRYRETQAKHGWTEANCKEMDQFAQEDHSYKVKIAELDRYRSNWKVQLNDSGDSGPMTIRADY